MIKKTKRDFLTQAQEDELTDEIPADTACSEPMITPAINQQPPYSPTDTRNGVDRFERIQLSQAESPSFVLPSREDPEVMPFELFPMYEDEENLFNSEPSLHTANQEYINLSDGELNQNLAASSILRPATSIKSQGITPARMEDVSAHSSPSNLLLSARSSPVGHSSRERTFPMKRNKQISLPAKDGKYNPSTREASICLRRKDWIKPENYHEDFERYWKIQVPTYDTGETTDLAANGIDRTLGTTKKKRRLE